MRATWATGCRPDAYRTAAAGSRTVHRGRPLAMRRTQAVGARITAADDDDVLALGRDGRFGPRSFAHQVRGLQVLHGPVHTPVAHVRPQRDPRQCGSAGQDHGVEPLEQIGGGDDRHIGGARRAQTTPFARLEGDGAVQSGLTGNRHRRRRRVPHLRPWSSGR